MADVLDMMDMIYGGYGSFGGYDGKSFETGTAFAQRNTGGCGGTSLVNFRQLCIATFE